MRSAGTDDAGTVDSFRRALAALPCIALTWPALSATTAKMDSKDTQERALAVQYLESIQRSAYKALGTLPRVYDDQFLFEFRQRMLESPMFANLPREEREKLANAAIARMRATSHSQYEDPLGFILISDLDAKIRKVLDRSSAKLSVQPVFGTLPTRNVNARTFAVPDSRTHIVAFEDQIWNFANLFAKAVALGVPSIGKDDGKETFSTDLALLGPWLRSRREPAQRLQELLQAYVVSGVPGAAPQYFLGEPHGSLAGILRDSMETFVLAHEYGHVIGGHLASGRTVRSAIADREFDEVFRSWAHELDADATGLQLTVAAGRDEGWDVSLSYWGADLFFTSLEIVERAVGLLRDGQDLPRSELDKGSASHPPPSLRRKRLREAAIAIYGDAGKAAVGLAEFIQKVVDELWKEISPRLFQLHKNGARPHLRWQAAAAPPAASAPR